MYKIYRMLPNWLIWFIKLIPGSKSTYRTLKKKYNKKYNSRMIKNAKKGKLNFNNKVRKSWNETVVIKNTMFFESYHGKNFTGSPMEMCKEALRNDRYKNFNLIVSIADEDKKNKIDKDILNSNRVTVVIRNSDQYIKMMHSSEYIYCNSTLSTWWAKKTDQKYTNTWHGDAVKSLGVDMEGSLKQIQNTQRNFLIADKIVLPSKNMKKIVLDSYMLPNSMSSKIIVEEAWRSNSALTNKMNKTILYAPTWRGSNNKGNVSHMKSIITEHIKIISKAVPKGWKIYASLHSFMKDIPLPKRVINIDGLYSVDQLVGCVDTVITDYSSIIVDTLNSDSKLIVLTTDIDEYENDRGLYKHFYKITEGLRVNNSEEFKKLFVTNIKTHKTKSNTKNRSNLDFIPKRVELKEKIIFGGTHNKNGITSSFNAFLNKRCSKNEYMIMVDQASCNKVNVKELISTGYKFLITDNKSRFTVEEEINVRLSYKSGVWQKENVESLNNFAKWNRIKNFANYKFKQSIDFSGYNKVESLTMPLLSDKNNVIIHNNFVLEFKNRNNIVPGIFDILCFNRSNFFAVSKDTAKSFDQFMGKKTNIRLLHNIWDNQKFNRLIKEIDESIELVLDAIDTEKTNIINVGRFSEEKQQLKLINSFEVAANQNKDINLYLIASYGPKKKQVLQRIKKSMFSDRITVITDVQNPMPIYKAMDGYIHTASHEGLPMVSFEAISAGLDFVSAREPWSLELEELGYSKNVDNNIQSISKAFLMFADGYKLIGRPTHVEWNKMCDEEYKIMEEINNV